MAFLNSTPSARTYPRQLLLTLSRELLVAADEIDHGLGYEVRVPPGRSAPHARALAVALRRAMSAATLCAHGGDCGERLNDPTESRPGKLNGKKDTR